MPVMEVRINDKPSALAGGEDFDLLTLGLMIAPDSTHPVVVLTGRKKGTDETLQWLNVPLRSGDRVQGILRRNGVGSPPPSAEQLVKSGQGEGVAPATSRVFVVKTSTQAARISSDAAGTLMVTATWHHLYEHCRLEISRLPRKETDPNRCWLESRVGFDEAVTIEIK